MIQPATGEIHFHDGLVITPRCAPEDLRVSGAEAIPMHSLPGWTRHELREHESAHGRFEVTAYANDLGRIHAVFLRHRHAFYEEGTPDDRERRVFHESIISRGGASFRGARFSAASMPGRTGIILW